MYSQIDDLQIIWLNGKHLSEIVLDFGLEGRFENTLRVCALRKLDRSSPEGPSVLTFSSVSIETGSVGFPSRSFHSDIDGDENTEEWQSMAMFLNGRILALWKSAVRTYIWHQLQVIRFCRPLSF